MGRALANLGLVLASLAFCGAALEISLRHVLPQPPLPTGSESLPRVALRPHYEPSVFARNVMARSAHTVEAWTGVTYPIDDRGYRGAGFPLEKPAGVTRILVYGGSAAFDVARSGEDDWPSHAGRLLRARGHRVEVINAAVPGHASFDSLGRFLAWNRRDEAEGPRPRAEPRNAFEPRQVAQFELVVATFVDLVRNAGGVPVLMTQARLPSATSPAEERERIRYDHVGLRHDALVAAFAAADAATRRVARHKHAPLIDARAALGHDPRFFLDPVHLTPEGSDALVERVADVLADVLERPPGATRHARAPAGPEGLETP